MIKNLLSYVKSLPTKMIKKNIVNEEINDIYSNIRLNVRPSIGIIFTLLKKAGDKRLGDIPFFKGTSLEKKYKSVSELVKRLNLVLDSVEVHRGALEQYSNGLPNTFATKGLTTNQALTLNVVENLRFMIEVAGDCSVVIAEYYNGTKESVFSSAVYHKKRSSLPTLEEIMDKYIRFDEVLVDLDNMVTTNTELVETVLSNKDMSGFVLKRFDGNPILWARILWADFELRRIKKLEADKEYIELMLADWELQQNNSYSTELEKSIENAKDMIVTIEYKIEKLKK